MSIQIDRGRVHDLSIARKHVKELYIYRCIMGDLAYKGFKEIIQTKLFIPINIKGPELRPQQLNQTTDTAKQKTRDTDFSGLPIIKTSRNNMN